MPESLLPCPFCGGRRIDMFEGQIGGTYAAAMCRTCHASGPEAVTRDEAHDLWNIRDGGGEEHQHDAG
jgi:Lar family restriction alleviation protein